MSVRRLIVATGNAGKLEEIKAILTEFEVVGAKEAGFSFSVVEDGADFRENAAIKARALKKLTDCAVLADDSGLCVDALGGKPGVHSARFAGEHATSGEHIDKLLKALEQVPENERTARFCCTVCLITEDGRELYGSGSCEGLILPVRRGDGGFGYDPVFYSLDFRESFGTLPAEKKNQISHRRRALADLLRQL